MATFDSSEAVYRSRTEQLAKLMNLDEATPDAWSDEDLAAMLRLYHDAGFDGVLVLLLFVIEIADAGAVIHAGGASDRAGGGEDFVDQRGLAGRTVSTENEVANLLDGILGHEKCP